MIFKNQSTRARGIIYYLLAAFFLLYEMSVQSSPSVMAVPMMDQLGFNPALFGAVMGAYFYSYTLMQIPVGLLFDRLPSKYLLVVAIALCALGSVMFAYSHSALYLGLSRFFTGFGSAFAFVGVLVIADEWFDAKHFAMLVGIGQLLAAIGAMGGEMPLAYWVNRFGWEKTALILAGIGVVILLAVLFFMEKTSPRKKGKNSHALIMTSLRHVFRNKQTFWVALYAFSAWAPITLFAELWGVPYLMQRYHTTNVTAALATSVIWIALAITSPLLGWYSDHIRKRCVLLETCSLVGVITILMILFIPKLPLAWLVLLMLGMGFAAAGQILSFALVRDNNPDSDLAAGIGFNNMAVVVGGAIFQPAVGWLLRWHALQHSVSGVVVYTRHDYHFALMVIPLCYVLGWISSRFFIRESFCQQPAALT